MTFPRFALDVFFHAGGGAIVLFWSILRVFFYCGEIIGMGRHITSLFQKISGGSLFRK
jgi:hypothetical protein